jgi:hypothetical protein
MRIPLLLAAGLALGLVRAAAADDLMRCDAAIVRVGMVEAEVVAKCGEPKSKQVEDVPIRARNAAGAVNVIGTTRVETWNYDRGYGQFPAVLKFEEGKLKSIELLRAR